MTHDEVAAYWYDADHEDCSLLRQGDIFENFLDNGWDYAIVVSRSCDLRNSPSEIVTVARADELETWLAENGAEITALNAHLYRTATNRFMLPRRPGHFETELIVTLDWRADVGAAEMCAAVEAGMAKARATDILSTVVGSQVAAFFGRPSVRVEIPRFDYISATEHPEPFAPGSAPFPARPIVLLGRRYEGKPDSARAGEVWYRVWVEGIDLLTSTARTLDSARRECAELIMRVREAPDELSGGMKTAVTKLTTGYFE